VTDDDPSRSRPSDDLQAPPVTEEIRERARRSPNSWIYSVDGAYEAAEEIPPYAVVGAWPVDENGQLGAFTANDNYRPSPAALQLDLPTDAVDAAVQLAATGHGSEGDVALALAASTIYLPANDDGDLIAYRREDGKEYVAIFTDPNKAPATAAQLLPTDIRSFLAVVPEDTTVAINPGGQVAASFTSGELRAALPTDA